MSKHMFPASRAAASTALADPDGLMLAGSQDTPPNSKNHSEGHSDKHYGRHSDRLHQLEALRETLQRLEASHRACATASGASAEAGRARPVLHLGDLDAHLPGDGLPAGVLNEITADYANRPAAYGFAFALMALAQQARSGPVVLVMSRRALRDFGHPYGHGLAQLGLDVGRLILVEAGKDEDALWAIEEALRAQGCVSMVAGAITGSVDLSEARRLNLAAQSAATPLALLRYGPGDAGPAATRWRITSAGAAKNDFGALSHPRWHASLERCRNGRPGHWLIEWNHVAHRFHLVESLAHRATVAQPQRRAAAAFPYAPPAGLRRAG